MVQTVADVAAALCRTEARYQINKVKYASDSSAGTCASYHFTDGRRDATRQIARGILRIGLGQRPVVRRALWAAFRGSWRATKAAITAPTQTPGGAL